MKAHLFITVLIYQLLNAIHHCLPEHGCGARWSTIRPASDEDIGTIANARVVVPQGNICTG
jgi:hypothetical protein